MLCSFSNCPGLRRRLKTEEQRQTITPNRRGGVTQSEKRRKKTHMSSMLSLNTVFEGLCVVT